MRALLRWSSPDPWINDADDFAQKYGREDAVPDYSFSKPQVRNHQHLCYTQLQLAHKSLHLKRHLESVNGHDLSQELLISAIRPPAFRLPPADTQPRLPETSLATPCIA